MYVEVIMHAVYKPWQMCNCAHRVICSNYL